MKKFFFAIALMVAASSAKAVAPLDSIGVTKINDKLHVRYMVSPGETIYGISTKFGVAVSDLMEINPELENGLKVGQVINIPYRPELVRREKSDDNTLVHKVAPGETLYSLSKKYGVPLADLLKWNGMELKAGQEIVVGYKDQKNLASANTASSQSTNTTANNTVATNTTPPKQEVKQEKPQNHVATEKVAVKEEPKTEVTKEPVAVKATPVKEEVKTVASTPTPPANNIQYYDPSMKQVLVIPFDPYLYFSDADDEIAAKSNMPRTKVRQVFRNRLQALLDKPGYEMIYFTGNKAKDSLIDLNKIYSSVTYNYQDAVVNANVSPSVQVQQTGMAQQPKKEKNWFEKQKGKIIKDEEAKYDVPEDFGSYFGVKVKNPEEFFAYFGNKYSADYYIFVSQFEVKTNYEHCLDRAALNFERSFTTHFSVFNANGKQIAGNKFKTHYNSNSNYIYTIVADNVPKIAERILAEIPAP